MTTPAITAAASAVLRAFLFLVTLASMHANAFDESALLAKLEAARVRYGVAGLSIALISRDRIVHVGGLGVADRATGRVVDADTLFRIGSVTKMFTGVAMLMGEADGAFRLDDPVRIHVNDVPYNNAWETTHPVRIAHLLEHTAGLSDLSRKEFDSSDPKPLSVVEAFAVDPGSRQIRWRPGMHSSYSNTGAGIAAYVLEQKTGVPYEHFVTQRIFGPLGMRSAGFSLDDKVKPRLAVGYDADGTTVMPYWHVLYRAFGGIHASARDMAHFTQWLLNRGAPGTPLLNDSAFDRLEQPRTSLAARSGLTYGYSLGIYAYAHRGQLFHGHGGDADGYLSRLGYNKDAGLGYFFSINAYKNDALKAMQEIIEDAIVADVRSIAKAQHASVDAKALTMLVGCYVPITKRFFDANEGDDDALLVRAEGNQLTTTAAGGRSRALIPVTDKHFRRADEPVATSAFVTDDVGDLFLQGDMGNLRRIHTSETARCP